MAVETHTRIVVVDDQPVTRKGVVFSLLAFDDLELVGEAGNGEEAVRLCQEMDPDVLLVDLMMPGMDGVAVIRAVHETCPRTQIVALTSFQEGTLVQDALHAGAIGYLLKDVEIDELARTIRLARRGMPVISAEAARSLVRAVTMKEPALGHDLTAREREVLALLVAGMSNQQIADELVIATATVKFHVKGIRTKLGTTTRTETVAVALKHHLVSAP
jgi:NarL family two-component system response regulator LiaR